jgi:hypothetical protein
MTEITAYITLNINDLNSPKQDPTISTIKKHFIGMYSSIKQRMEKYIPRINGA